MISGANLWITIDHATIAAAANQQKKKKPPMNETNIVFKSVFNASAKVFMVYGS